MMDNVTTLNNIFGAFKISATCKQFFEHKNAYFYDVELKPGTRIRDLEKYAAELSLALKAPSKPRIKAIPELGLLRLEFMKLQDQKVDLFELGYKSKMPVGKLNCLIGETLEGAPLWIDIVSNPHMLIAGTTGSGKSTMLHTIIANLLMYHNTYISLMDPKNIEFYKYSGLWNYKLGVNYSYSDCVQKLSDLCDEMERRYTLMRTHRISSDYFPYIVLIIDEFADLILQDADHSFHGYLCKLAQKSRAAGIHIILSTQRPSVDIVDGSIKANFPARLSCKVATNTDSRVILDTPGAELLLGKGDSLLKNNQFSLQRFQGAYTTPEEVINYFGGTNASSSKYNAI